MKTIKLFLNSNYRAIIIFIIIGVLLRLSYKFYLNINEIDPRVNNMLWEIKDLGYDVEKTLITAGKNKVELEKVLIHYKLNSPDSQKFEAACFLISNMINHKAAYYNNNEFEKVFEKIGEKKLAKGKHKGRGSIWDSVAQKFEKFNYNNVQYKHDQEIISSKFLIDNIEYAFKAWKTFPWCKSLSFEDFKNYILPYRISNEPIESCRSKFIENYSWIIEKMKDENNMKEAFKLIYNDFYSKIGTTSASKYPLAMSYTEFYSAKSGNCGDASNSVGMALRSMGVKCSYDYSVQWGNRKNMVHGWISYPENDNITFFIDNDETLKIPNYVHSGKFEIDEPGTKYLFENIEVQKYKRGTKIRRNTFATNPKSLFFKKNIKEKIFNKSNDLNNIDVTNHYLETSNIILQINEKLYLNQFIYLTVFGLYNNSIVELSENINNKVRFKDLGVDVIYFPKAYINNKLKSISSPFLLKKNNEFIEFKPDTTNLISMSIKRKYPLFGNILNKANSILYSSFEASNDSTFNKATPLFKIKNTYLFPSTISIQNKNKYRYFRFLNNTKSEGSIAEIRIHSKENKWNSNFKIISDKSIKEGKKAFDGNLSTYCSVNKTGSWIGVDLGKGGELVIDKIFFSPRSDTNFVIAEDYYELFYWGNSKWISLGIKKANNYEIKYEKVPSNTIYWLHYLGEGSEERPFTYENGNQIWW
tara:strand:+ start:8593 stop:10692 length:2100 start_codon:yes stop_codon:yes gene_type:complete